MIAGKKSLGRRWSSPTMAKLAARSLIKHSMNATQAAKELRPHLTEQSARSTGRRMMNTPEALEELEKLAPLGLDEASRDQYVKILWSWLQGEDKEKAQTAARILGKAFISDKLQIEQVEPLRIEGIEEGLKTMLGDASDSHIR
jgi:phage terminase small subunit